jgi:hypothetical protein
MRIETEAAPIRDGAELIGAATDCELARPCVATLLLSH